MQFFTAALSIIFFIITPAHAADRVQNEITEAQLISEYDTVKPGDTFQIGVLLKPRYNWHTYWQNPGDAGIPTTMEWTAPDSVAISSILWPVPEPIREDILIVFGYKNDVLLPVTVTVPADYTADTLPVSVSASWLVCDDICIPESAELDFSLHIADARMLSTHAALFESARANQPKPLDTPLTFTLSQEHITLHLPEKLRGASDGYFFPYQENVLDYAASPTMSNDSLTIARAASGDEVEKLSGYLKLGGTTYEIMAEKNTSHANAPSDVSAGEFIFLLLFAILGGLILNLMPCVLPVLSLKALAIAQKARHERRIVVKQSLAYTAGVLVSFALIAGLLISLQQAGEVIGWGYQMQSPVFVGVLIVLLFLVGLNLVGMFEVPVLFGSAVQDTNEHRLRGSFLTGVLATAVATPCTAPFMATAVGATLTLPPILALLIFLGIGLGLALPFLLIAIFPPLIKFLPKPGAWMETFKQFLSFPMFASVIWLLWVITAQSGPSGLLVILITLLLITFLIWLKMHCKDASPVCRIAIILLLLAALINGLSVIANLPTPVAAMIQEEHTEAFDESRIEELRSQGHAVFVDATAAWCLTCQVNKRIAIDTEASRAAFEDTDTVLMIADWTNRNKSITQFLKRFGYNGVPLYVYFPISGEPVVLPQILSESLVISTLKGETHGQ